MKTNRMKALIQSGKPAFGVSVMFPAPELVEMIGELVSLLDTGFRQRDVERSVADLPGPLGRLRVADEEDRRRLGRRHRNAKPARSTSAWVPSTVAPSVSPVMPPSRRRHLHVHTAATLAATPLAMSPRKPAVAAAIATPRRAAPTAHAVRP